MSKAYIISDTHVKSRLWTNFAGIQGDAYRALELISEKAENEIIISCGDLFDSNRPSSTDLASVSDLCKKVKMICYINGNHDDCFPSILPSLTEKCLHLTSSNPVQLENINLFGIDWQNTRDKILEELTNIASTAVHQKEPEKTVVIMHQSLQEFFAKGAPVTASDIWEILGESAAVIIGDIHSNQLIESPSKKGFILSPGPLVPQDIGQAKKEQFFHTLDLQTRELTKIPIQVRSYYFLDGTDAKFDLGIALSTIHDDSELPAAVILKVKPNYILPKNIPENFIVVTAVQFDKVSYSSLHTVETSIDEAVETEIDTTEKENAKLMKTLYNNLKMSDTPDEVLQSVLEKWKVVLG